MACWHTAETVWIGDAFGHSRRVRVNGPTAAKRTRFGTQLNENSQNRPGPTAGLMCRSDVIETFQTQRLGLSLE
jgi:hypothetical protein